MGTNYYLRYNFCPYCGRYDEVHIGKASAGWKFVFATQEIVLPSLKARDYLENIATRECYISSAEQWFTILDEYKDMVKIYDEYDRLVSLEDFKKVVETHQKDENIAPNAHIDEDGYVVLDVDFS